MYPQSAFHLYLAWGCPFCHRITAALAMTGLGDALSITWTKNVKQAAGWELEQALEPLFGAPSIKEVYENLAPGKHQRYSVPLLVNRRTKTLISTESSVITRMITTGFEQSVSVRCDLAPEALVEKIDETNRWLHAHLNRAVYWVGFAEDSNSQTQRKLALFDGLAQLNHHLKDSAYLLGDTLTESDLYLFATLTRFNTIYYWLFQCNMQFIEDFPALFAYFERLRHIEVLRETYHEQLAVEHYYESVMHVEGRVKDLNPEKKIPHHVIEKMTYGT